MESKRRFSRLGAKLAGVSVLGLALAFAIFYTVESIVLPWLLYDERFAPVWKARADAVAAAYQSYVTEHNLDLRQASNYLESLMPDMYATAFITAVHSTSSYETKEERFSPVGAYGYTYEAEDQIYTIISKSGFDVSAASLRLIKCADGDLYLADAAGILQVRSTILAGGLLLALAGFCAVMIPCIVRLVRRIGALSRETGVLMAGDLDHAIHIRGRDELSGLGEDIERLRQSVNARLEGEREAVGANSRLITSLSHDLRTPLTKLTGYLDILAYRKYQSQEEHDGFLRLASEKAAQIKTLTDQLFASAQVDAPEAALELPPERVDGAALLGQLLAEECDGLRREGFDAQPPVFRQKFALYLRTADAVRVFDNLFSNLKKYADPAFPVKIRARDKGETVVLRFENHVCPAPDRTDSHGLGVPTMRELMSRSGGTLETSEEKGIYTSTLTFRKHWEPR